MEIFTVGHGTASREELLDRLALGDVRRLVDVRTAPGSRRHPHLARAELEQWVPAAGISYRWDKRLGGFRKAAPDSPDVALRNDSFRGYAGHLRSADARAGLADLLADAGAGPTAFLCSETVWWRCHRRMIADALMLLHGVTVTHLMPGRAAPHRPTEGVRVVGPSLVYDAGQDQLGGDPACWLNRVCFACGRLNEHGDTCAECGEPLPA